ncbi:MAG: hypothetical protein JRL30_29775, partial [Deltaproteobacteria bacterium]|nr:hypothetical protein [Deltaproteobacteria bacterium]
ELEEFTKDLVLIRDNQDEDPLTTATAEMPIIKIGSKFVVWQDIGDGDYDIYFKSNDSVPPVISNNASTPACHDATVSWDTNENANGTLDWGNTTALGNTTSNSSYITSMSMDLSNLNESMTYYYNITACDSAENCDTIGPGQFTTTADADSDGWCAAFDPDDTNDTIPGAGGDDLDGDGMDNDAELLEGTDPADWDSDDDGYGDGDEYYTAGTDPNDSASVPAIAVSTIEAAPAFGVIELVVLLILGMAAMVYLYR